MCVSVCVNVMYATFFNSINMDFESVNKRFISSDINESCAIVTVTAQLNTTSFVVK